MLATIFSIVGAFFVLSLGILLAWITFCSFRDRRQAKLDEAMKRWQIGQFESVIRWCSYEFPDVELAMNRLTESTKHGWGLNCDELRNALRALKTARESKDVAGGD